MTDGAKAGSAESDQPPATGATPSTSEAPEEGSFDLAEEDLADGEDQESDGDTDGAEARGHDESVVAESIQTKNAIIGSHLSIAGDLVIGDAERVAVPVADVTVAIEVAERTYVAPDYYQRLTEALAEPKVIVLIGAACGKRTTAGVALRRAGHRPIVQMPSDMPVRHLVGGIEKLCEKSKTAGVVVEAVDPTTLVSLTNFEVHRLTKLLSGGARVVLTASSPQGLPQHLDGVTLIHCSAPSPGDVVKEALGSDDAKRRAVEAIGLLEGRTWSPSDALALLERARDPEQSPQDLAQAFDSSATGTVLDQWLSTERSAKYVACLVAAATLDGESSVDVDAVADTLAEMFAAGLEEPSEGVKMFRVADRGWPEGVLQLARRSTGTHFGYHEMETVRVCPPHTRSQIIQYLWLRLGADFRRPFVRWLGQLAEHPNARIRKGAAVTAGILFTIDPVIAERELIKPWALGNRFSQRLCAAIALGTPVAIGADPAGARALAKTWSTSSNLQLERVAVLAYGGLLGAWDPASAAPVHLWRMGTETPELTRSANVSIASLMAAGASAARIRAGVLGILHTQAGIERVPSRVYALLPLVMKHLTARGALARESLKALINQPQEHETFSMLGTLLAHAFVAPPGYQKARIALSILLRSVADGRVEQTVAFTILSAVRAAAADEKTLDALNARLKRALSAGARERTASAEVARAALSEFYPANKEQPLGAR